MEILRFWDANFFKVCGWKRGGGQTKTFFKSFLEKSSSLIVKAAPNGKWDYAATILLLKEFGGKMTSLDGSAMPFGGQKRIRPGFKWSRGILLFIKPWGIIYLRSITIKNNLMPNKIGKWEELSREIAFQKYSRKIEKVMDKISDKKER